MVVLENDDFLHHTEMHHRDIGFLTQQDNLLHYYLHARTFQIQVCKTEVAS